MRANDARKWLHAGLDLLPLILIPVFMIYSHRHTMTQQTSVDVQYKYETNEVNSVDDVIEGNIYSFNVVDDTIDSSFYVNQTDFKLLILNVYEYNFDNYSPDLNDIIASNYYGGGSVVTFLYIDSDLNGYIQTYLGYNDYEDSFTSIYLGTLTDSDFTFKADGVVEYISGLFDYIVFSSTDFNVIESVEVHDETSSVMNVFMDNFNGAIDKYFNMGNVFNLNGVYDWFNNNLFGGNAPSIIYSIWNIALYELIMDLLFLLYGLFMWFIDMMKHIMEKPFRAIK